MLKSLSVAKFIYKENLSNKVFNGILFFASILILGTLALKELALYDGAYVVRNTGLFFIEFFVFLIAAFISSSYIIRDHKEKSIYLILTKPISRDQYIIGVIVGHILIIISYVMIMGIFLIGLLIFIKSPIDIDILISYLFIILKISILVSFGVFFSTISDSFVTASVFTFSFYGISHIAYELQLMADKMKDGITKYFIKMLHYILPRFYMLNYRDIIGQVKYDYITSIIYSICYLTIVSILAILCFKKRKL